MKKSEDTGNVPLTPAQQAELASFRDRQAAAYREALQKEAFSVPEQFDELGCTAARIELMSDANDETRESNLPQINADATAMLRGLERLRASVLGPSPAQPPAPTSNSWPKPISAKVRMPAQPDADTCDLYLGFLGDEQGWSVVQWNGTDFMLQWGDEAIDVVTHWIPLPPDPAPDDEVTR